LLAIPKTFHLAKHANALREKFKDMSNRLVLLKVDVGCLFAGRGEASAGVESPHHLRTASRELCCNRRGQFAASLGGQHVTREWGKTF